MLGISGATRFSEMGPACAISSFISRGVGAEGTNDLAARALCGEGQKALVLLEQEQSKASYILVKLMLRKPGGKVGSTFKAAGN
eukprot:1853378-Amphidinium_carterae.1